MKKSTYLIFFFCLFYFISQARSIKRRVVKVNEVEAIYFFEQTKKKNINQNKSGLKASNTKSKSQQEKTSKSENSDGKKNLQKELLNIKNSEVERKKREIALQDTYLANQRRLIKEQGNVLNDQQGKLDIQRRINLLLVIGGVLSSVFMVYIIIININRRELVRRLKDKNKEIARKSIALERQNKELEQFAYIASHDLQEPLHTVTSFADFMYEDYSEILDEDGKENLNFIKQGCERMRILITSLLDYSRIGSRRELKYINPKNIVSTVIQDFNVLINSTGAQIKFGKMPMIYAYPTELRMLFQNLISNAIKFRKPEVTPEIYIEGFDLPKSKEYSKRWQFKVMDNGIGIANEHQKKIFDIFQRLHTREDYEGTGIGLAHCKKVVSFHHGDIWINSTVGKGTTFNFTIQFNPEEYTNKTVEVHKYKVLNSNN